MPPIELPHLSSGPVRLRPPTESDVSVIARCCQDPDVQRFTRVPSPYTRADARAFVRFSRDSLANGRGVHLLAVDERDRVLGAIGLGIDVADLSGELGYWIAPEARRRGVAVRGGRLLLEFAFGPLELGYVGLHAAASNAGSNAVARRLGFVHEGTLRDAMVDGPSGDRRAPRVDANVWGIRPGELPL
ncbi:GNAT family N-acetyltransferase [Egicoccus sp. AB-alg6-2]|uniref:GNAT family N-acetyltransferase n=1 Tax=Egicoccus sp. AB-alg6-2 TaxID=3242692 RepID=UPI00359ECD5F